jgi:hypothetical protein
MTAAVEISRENFVPMKEALPVFRSEIPGFQREGPNRWFDSLLLGKLCQAEPLAFHALFYL